jgi:succinoglycan biosynthesis protein ExoO
MSADGPLVTVGIPSYESSRFIEAAVRSALAQDFTDLEVLVIDDQSSDDTVALLAAIDDGRLRVLVNDTNLGAGRNWNRVLEEARGR